MNRLIILDTGPLVALINRNDPHHEWAQEHFAQVPELLTCDSVLSEACFLLQKTPGGVKAAMDLFGGGVVQLAFRLADEINAVCRLMEKYADRPMSLADACLVRMAELHDNAVVFTLDSADFSIYRKHGNKKIPTLMP